MHKVLAAFLLTIVPALSQASPTEVRFFPPRNHDVCSDQLPLLTWFGGINDVNCMSGQDLLRSTISCREGQEVAYEGGTFVCRTPPQPGTCRDGEFLTYDGSAYHCAKTSVPTCATSEVLTFDGSGFVCVPRTDSIPTCGAGQFLTFNGSRFQCANTQRLSLPTCSDNQYLRSDGATLACADLPASTPAEDAMIVRTMEYTDLAGGARFNFDLLTKAPDPDQRATLTSLCQVRNGDVHDAINRSSAGGWGFDSCALWACYGAYQAWPLQAQVSGVCSQAPSPSAVNWCNNSVMKLHVSCFYRSGQSPAPLPQGGVEVGID